MLFFLLCDYSCSPSLRLLVQCDLALTEPARYHSKDVKGLFLLHAED